MAAWAGWLLLGAVCLFYGGLVLFEILKQPVDPTRPIADEGDAFFVAMAVTSLIVGILAVAVAIPAISTPANRVWNVVVGAAIAAGLLWGALAALRRSSRLLFGTEEDLDPHFDRTWTLQALVARLVTAVLGFWIGAAAIGVLCFALAIVMIGQLGNLWDLNYSQVSQAFDAWTLLDGVVAKAALVVLGPVVAVRSLLGLERAGPIRCVVAAVLAGTWCVISLTWVGWLDASSLVP